MRSLFSIFVASLLLLAMPRCSGCSDSDSDRGAHSGLQPSKRDFMQYNRRLFWCDSVCIAHYSDSLGLNAEPTPTCLWLTVRDEGSGTEISQGDRVTLSYVVSNLRGDTLYNSAVDGIRSVNVGRAEFTIGLDEALVQLRRGADATAILIPEKAYGVRGDAKKVRGRMILRFDFCVIE